MLQTSRTPGSPPAQRPKPLPGDQFCGAFQSTPKGRKSSAETLSALSGRASRMRENRRCSASSDSPEIRSIAENVNLLLDDTDPRGKQTATDSNSQ